jgi:hypothetical protein
VKEVDLLKRNNRRKLAGPLNPVKDPIGWMKRGRGYRIKAISFYLNAFRPVIRNFATCTAEPELAASTAASYPRLDITG